MSAWNVCLDKTYFCSCSDSTDWLRKKLIVFVSRTRDVVVAWQFVLTFGVLSVVVIIMLRLCNTTYNNGEYTTHFPNEPELVYKIRENSINDRFKSADLPSTFWVHVKDISTSVEMLLVHVHNRWMYRTLPGGTRSLHKHTHGSDLVYAFRDDDIDDRSQICKSVSNVVFLLRKCTYRRMYITLNEWIRTLDKY